MPITINKNKYNILTHVVDTYHKAYDGILGMNFLEQHNACVDVGACTLKLGENSDIPLSKYAHGMQKGVNLNDRASSRLVTQSILRNSQSEQIPSGNSRTFMLRVPKCMQHSEVYFIEPLAENAHLDNINCYVARSISNTISKNNFEFIPITIVNLSRQNATIMKGITLAHISIINENDIKYMNDTNTAEYNNMHNNANDMNVTVGDVPVNCHVTNKDIVCPSSESTESIESNQESSDIFKYQDYYRQHNYLPENNSTLRYINSIETSSYLDKNLLHEKLKHLPPEQYEKVKVLILKYAKLFIDCYKPPADTTITHRIVTTSENPVRRPGYRIAKKLQPVIDDFIERSLNIGRIRPGFGPWSAGIVLVRKKSIDGSVRYRVTSDYRGLNMATLPESFPTPHISETIDNLADSQYFVLIDLKDAFYAIPMEEESKEKTGFSVPSGKFAGNYEFNFMPQGLKNSSATFLRFIHGVLYGLTPLQCCVFVDDIIVFGKDFDTTFARLDAVLQRLHNANLTVLLDKCKFFVNTVVYLAHEISQQGIRPDPRLIQIIQDFPPSPTQIAQIQSILGLSGFYRKMIKNYSSIVYPLTELVKNATQPNIEYFSPECQQALQEVKNILISRPILHFPRFDSEFILTTDASNTCLGAVLSQKDPCTNIEHPIAYASRKMSPCEQRTTCTEREMLALVWACTHFKYYLLGQENFQVYTDHSALKYMQTMKNPSSKIMRWLIKLSDYNMTVTHKPGRHIAHADALSRFVHKVDNGYVHKIDHEKIISTFDLQKLQHEQLTDQDCHNYRNKKSFFIQDNILYKSTAHGDRIVLPLSLRNTVLHQFHDSILSGHSGKRKVLIAVAKQYWWPNRRKFIFDYISSCLKCAERDSTPKTRVPLQSLPDTVQPFDRIGLDITELPMTSRGNKYILTIIDHFSRFLIMIPLRNQTSETIASKLVKHLILPYQLPSTWISDQGANFMSHIMTDLAKLLNIERLRTSSYHPMCNGRTEIVHKTLKKWISFYVNQHQSNWDELLDYAVASYNNTLHASTQFTPHEIIYGNKKRSPFDIVCNPDTSQLVTEQHVQNLQQKLRSIWSDVQLYNKKAFAKQETQYNKKLNLKTFQVKDQVMLHNPVVAVGKSRKLNPAFTGPHEIIAIKPPCNYYIMKNNKKLLVHANRLKLYREHRMVDFPLFPSQQSVPPATTQPTVVPSTATPQPVAAQSPSTQTTQPATLLSPPSLDTTPSTASTSTTSRTTTPRVNVPPTVRRNLRPTQARREAGFYNRLAR